MVNPRLLLAIENERIETEDILSFEYTCDIDTGFPKAIFVINDKSGEKLSRFYNLAIGSVVRFSVVDEIEGQTNPSRALNKFCELRISAIGDAFENMSRLTGAIQILAVHPWEFFKEHSSKIFHDKCNSEIILDILGKSGRSWEFNIDRDLIEQSDESGSQPRYMVCESDKDFILNKILPNTLINRDPPIFWIDEVNRPHLTTFNNLFRKDYVAVAAYEPSILEYRDLMKDLVNDNADNVFMYNSMKLNVNDENYSRIIDNLKIDVLSDGQSIAGSTVWSTFAPQIKINSLSMVGNKMPVAISYLGKLDCTAKKAQYDSLTKDGLASVKSSLGNFYDLFTLSISGRFSGPDLKTGDNINLFFPALNPDGTVSVPQKEIHWISGLWNVKAVRHILDKPNEIMTTTLTVRRPTFLYDANKTTLTMPSMLQEC